MRDILADVFLGEPIDPTEAARRSMGPKRLRRFYQSASVGEAGGEYPLLLDGRAVKTPARHGLAAPTRALAEAIAAEWECQGEHVDPARMPLTRLVNSIIDGVVPAPGPVAAEIVKYLGSDMLFYRADAPEGLVARQTELWDPIIDWAHETLGARFMLAEGIRFVEQPERAIANAAAAIPDDPWRLGAVHSITTLTGSALLALAVLRRRIDAGEAWRAAHVDEDWNMELWGRDEAALERRAFRFAEMQAAAKLIDAVCNLPEAKA